MRIPLLLLVLFFYGGVSCNPKENENPPPLDESMYFPPSGGSIWETIPISSLGWNESQVPALLDFLESKNTKSFLILVNGRIALEEYFDGHSASATWQWNSAGKTLVASTIGIAQQEGLIDINTKVSEYLGDGWTSEPIDKENLINSKHLLSMTSGIDDSKQLVIKSNLTYLADAGSRWSYHNVFQKLMDVVGEASGEGFEPFFGSRLKNKIGMDGFWSNGLIFKIYHSSTRSMAKFGLLALNKGMWMEEQVIEETFFTQCINTSQNLNPSYGYLWWLNGKNQFMLPGGQTVYPGPLIASAPADMYAAMGAEDQRIYVVPSKKLVIIRMGKASDPANPNFALSGFDEALWEKINAVIN
ncbi:serine hydrolase [Algoriphagus sp. D3-2-R+10]|uniref:serine hydrolase domain-containing protein n=1 Tax=Algoriphagus aurantiacus TaxID=3103948 RepID=UPI002B3A5FA4|nr:serine hydrolase [Algoriphagus sp. D3-2-R+10]MEB2775126.1 serine hydrolase [Algoriphagus sp. D3-2-R+10]